MAKQTQEKKERKSLTVKDKMNARVKLIERQFRKLSRLETARTQPTKQQVETLRTWLNERTETVCDGLIASLDREAPVEETFEPVIED